MKRALLSLSLLALLASCVNDDVLNTSDFITNVLITADDVQMAESESCTRTDLTLASGALQFAWAAEDVVGIYPNEGDQVSFPMTKGAGTKSANFDGGGWAVKSSCTYAAYFPYSVDNTTYGRPYTALPLSYTGQCQTANSSTAHLGDYDYMVATASAPSNGSIAFNFTHINSFLYVQLTTPDAATFTNLTLATDDDLFVEEATVNIATGVITPTETSESLALDLNNIAVAAGSTLYAWMAVAPVNLLNKTLTATLTTTEGTSYKADIDGKTLATGRAYVLKGMVAAEGTGGSGGDIPLDDYAYVDLGLSSGLLWATCNVGAENPEDYGDYFAWGETETKDTYDWSTYKWCNGTYTTQTKYCVSSSYGIIDNKTVLDADDDVAHVQWGDYWRMPTKAEQDELRIECTWTWTQVKGVDGYKVTGSNGNFIFLPASGVRKNSDLYVGTEGYYWSSSLYTSSSSDAYYVYIYLNGFYREGYDRCYGRSVRPVWSEPVAVESVTLSSSKLTLIKDATAKLTATVSPSNAANKALNWSSSDGTVAIVNENGVVTAIKAGIATITASSVNGKQDTCTLTVTDVPTHTYVDLGLPSGLLWATCNVGAENPEDYGDYYAWGETEPYYKEENAQSTAFDIWKSGKSSGYDWPSYKWCNGLYDTQTKYCTNYNFGTVDNKTVLDLEDDVAHVQWGANWRMPTYDEMDELKNNCAWKWTQVNGVYGRKVTGPNGASIFLPAAGYRDNSYLDVGSDGDYWSSSLNTNYSSHAFSLGFRSGDVGWRDYGRCYGRSVRPVCTK